MTPNFSSGIDSKYNFLHQFITTSPYHLLLHLVFYLALPLINFTIDAEMTGFFFFYKQNIFARFAFFHKA